MKSMAVNNASDVSLSGVINGTITVSMVITGMAMAGVTVVHKSNAKNATNCKLAVNDVSASVLGIHG